MVSEIVSVFSNKISLVISVFSLSVQYVMFVYLTGIVRYSNYISVVKITISEQRIKYRRKTENCILLGWATNTNLLSIELNGITSIKINQFDSCILIEHLTLVFMLFFWSFILFENFISFLCRKIRIWKRKKLFLLFIFFIFL